MAKLFSTTPELRKIAYEQLNEVENRISADIATLRNWIEMQPHLKTRTDERFLLAFLRGSKYSLEKAKSKLSYFYTVRPIIPEMFENIGVNETNLGLCRSNTYMVLPKPLGNAGPRMHLTICANLDLEKFTFMDLFRYQRMLLEAQIFNDDNYTISGHIEIYDVSNVGMKFLSHFDFVLLKKLSIVAEKATPIRLKGVYIINCPKEAYTLLNFGKNLLPKKLQTRVNVYKNLDDLCEVIPQIYLPHEYGGKNGTLQEIQEEAKKILTKYDYENDNQYGINEQFYNIQQINDNEIFGIEGSFRKLDID